MASNEPEPLGITESPETEKPDNLPSSAIISEQVFSWREGRGANI